MCVCVCVCVFVCVCKYVWREYNCNVHLNTHAHTHTSVLSNIYFHSSKRHVSRRSSLLTSHTELESACSSTALLVCVCVFVCLLYRAINKNTQKEREIVCCFSL